MSPPCDKRGLNLLGEREREDERRGERERETHYLIDFDCIFPAKKKERDRKERR